jgi:hypothetical protein
LGIDQGEIVNGVADFKARIVNSWGYLNLFCPNYTSYLDKVIDLGHKNKNER